LEYWTIGIRKRSIGRKVASALDGYRGAFQEFAEAAVQAARERVGPRNMTRAIWATLTPDTLAATAVSLVHGCALQAVIDPRRFEVGRHKNAAAQMLADLA
jgi:hypothetical protein